MLSSKAQHPNCGYLFMNHIISPEANAQATEYFGEAPANSKACALTTNPDHCDIYHATDEEYFSKVHYWATPQAECLDGRTDVDLQGLLRVDRRPGPRSRADAPPGQRSTPRAPAGARGVCVPLAPCPADRGHG